MWAGAKFQHVEYFVYGVLLITIFGIDFPQAIIATVLGNLSFLLLGFASLEGPQTGTTVFAINRAPFGPNGSRLLAFFNWLTQVGFETEGLILIVFAGEILTVKAGFVPGDTAKVIFVIAGVAVQLFLPLLGHATIVKVLRLLILPFVVLYAVLAALTLNKANFDVVHVGAGMGRPSHGRARLHHRALRGSDGPSAATTTSALYLQLRRAEAIRDRRLGLPRDRGPGDLDHAARMRGRDLHQRAALAGGNPFAAASSTPHIHVFATGFVVPFLIVAIFQLFAINSLDLYSSGVTLQAIGLPVKRWHAVIIDTSVCLVITLYAIFNSSFSNLLRDFVDIVVVWIAPWLAIYLIDWLLRAKRYEVADLQRQQFDAGSMYYRYGRGLLAGHHRPGHRHGCGVRGLSATFPRSRSWMHEV